jgi:hypothetical protein
MWLLPLGRAWVLMQQQSYRLGILAQQCPLDIQSVAAYSHSKFARLAALAPSDPFPLAAFCKPKPAMDGRKRRSGSSKLESMSNPSSSRDAHRSSSHKCVS